MGSVPHAIYNGEVIQSFNNVKDFGQTTISINS